jgi:hypothetical protein
MNLTKQQFIEKVLPNLPEDIDIEYDMITVVRENFYHGKSKYENDEWEHRFKIVLKEPIVSPKSQFKKKILGYPCEN